MFERFEQNLHRALNDLGGGENVPSIKSDPPASEFEQIESNITEKPDSAGEAKKLFRDTLERARALGL